MVIQRIFAAVLLLACAGLALMAWPYQAPFSYEPVGPRAFPLLMLGLMGAALLYLLIRPTPIVHTEEEPALDRETLIKIGACIILLLIFAGLFEPLGFILSSILTPVWRTLAAERGGGDSDERRPLPVIRQGHGRSLAFRPAQRSGELIWILSAT
ncbi:Membrane protein TctB [Pseudomonas syringae pv. cerasicola]|uniref:Membrane protein TctB n=2 Tax=Pseudomonas syringae group TaxID=136849 RepID=A0A0P9NHM6_PSESX|nr:Membrane protein TctB [Pseudomonas syringae pv. cerasicola]RMS67268.1 Membrane protein TctB [Pseudomonas savastanoi]RMS85937.1 Membrane protein TctB [Pseudomonas savastanoi]RMT39831.1 Membrane protein TctB [Pseudomonas savastanoi]SOS14841.1 putative membrane protein [Pseudomonas syringae pv. cerasicola]